MLMLPLAATLFLASSAAAAAAPAVPTAAAPAAPVYAPVTIEENGEGCEQYTTESSGLSVELCQGSWIGEDGEEIVEDREGELLEGGREGGRVCEEETKRGNASSKRTDGLIADAGPRRRDHD
jgi:hypothetical protein